MDQNPPPVPLLFAMLLAVGGSISVWWLVFLKWRSGEVILPREPRRPVPWGAGYLCLIALLYVVTQVAVVVTVMSIAEIVLPGLGAEALLNEDGGVPPEKLAPVLLANAMANLIVVGVAIGLLSILGGATPHDFGFLPWRPSYDIPLGIAAFLASLLPVYAIQLVLTQFFPSEHPVQQLLTSDSSGAMLVLCLFSAVLVAPVAEEFLFRGILQGWLEAAVMRRRDWGDPSLQEPQPLVDQSRDTLFAPPPAESSSELAGGLASNPYQSPTAASVNLASDTAPSSYEPQTRLERWLPIGVSSFLFAIVHLGNGPDPIPLFVLAVILGYLYQQTHRLWPCIVLHMCLNAASLAMLLASLKAQ